MLQKSATPPPNGDIDGLYTTQQTCKQFICVDELINKDVLLLNISLKLDNKQ